MPCSQALANAPPHHCYRDNKADSLQKVLHRLALAHLLRVAALQHRGQQLHELRQGQRPRAQVRHGGEPALVRGQGGGPGDGLCVGVCHVGGVQ